MTPYLAARGRRRQIERSAPQIAAKQELANGGQQAAPAGHAADHLNVGRSADRRRWLGAPLAHEDSARKRMTGPITLIFQCRLFCDTP